MAEDVTRRNISREAMKMRTSRAPLAPDFFAKVRLPFPLAETLPPQCYYSADFYEREVEHIFMKVWNFIGRADHIPLPGDYFTLDFVGVPIIVIRDREGGLNAYANTCRHRGAKLVEGQGNAKVLVCPYHGWSYDARGRLIAAPEMQHTEGFDRACYPLKRIRLETWEGFVFINFDPDAESLMEYLGDLPSTLASYRFGDMKQAGRVEYELDCNWKIYAENAMEAYHVAMVHAKSLQKLKRELPPVVPSRGNWCGLHTRHEGSRALLAGDTGFPAIQGLEGLAALGTYYTLIYPSTMFGCTIDCMWWFEVHPLGPERMRLIVGSCFPKETVQRDDFEDVVKRYERRWATSVREDNDISELQQKGIRSPYAEPGRLSHMEELVHRIGNWIADRLTEGEQQKESAVQKRSAA